MDAAKPARTWTVPAVVVAVVDGDTLRLDYDLGWRVALRDVPLRLSACDAPELSTPEGLAAAQFTLGLVPPGTAILVTSHGFDKYGRTLGAVRCPDGRDLATALLVTGHARPYHGGPRMGEEVE